MLCERCKKEAHYLELDPFCGRKICQNCIKSSKRVKETKQHVVICKDCWGDIEKRKKFKSM